MMGDSESMEQTNEEGRNRDPYMIVGLGNPGANHKANRHNVGFMAVDRLADDTEIPIRRVQHRALFGKGEIYSHPLMLVKPQTFMNRSGDSIGLMARYYKIPASKVLVVYDELDLPLGSLRLRQKGGSGGHNGMKSVIQHLGDGFPRMRLGIGRPPGRMDPAAYVLQDFSKDQIPIADEMLDAAVAAIVSFVRVGVDLAMTLHNKK